MAKNDSTRIVVAPRQTKVQRYTKVAPISHFQENPSIFSKQQEILTTRLDDQTSANELLRKVTSSVGIEDKHRENVLSNMHLTHNTIPIVKNKSETYSKFNSSNNKIISEKRLIVSLVIMSLFLATTFTISIYLLILITTKTQTTETTSTTTSTIDLYRWNRTGITVAGLTGSSGTATNQLTSPYHLALDSIESLYICDTGNHRIQKYFQGASSGTLIAGVSGTPSTSAIYFSNPTGITIDSSNNIYVADRSNNRIQAWLNRASSGTTIITGVSNPYSIARDSNSNTFYIADTGNHRIISYLMDTSTSSVIAGTGTSGYGPTQLSSPRGVYFDSSSSSLIIANSGAHNIVRWILGDTTWSLIAGTTGFSGSLSTQLSSPGGVTLDYLGNVYVADTGNHRIQLFLAGQSNGITIAGISAMSGNNLTLLNSPSTIVLDKNRNFYVADTANHRIQKFQRY